MALLVIVCTIIKYRVVEGNNLEHQTQMKFLLESQSLRILKNQPLSEAANLKSLELASAKCDPTTLATIARAAATVSANLMNKSKSSRIFTKSTKVNLTAK